tara:strand:+ start:48 stop:308 length:261 start_codon:yes stop_codon:yes gene_type:complete
LSLLAEISKGNFGTKKEILKPYLSRHRFAKQSHAAGIPVSNIAAAMGHTIEVHLENYARFTPEQPLIYTTRQIKRIRLHEEFSCIG